MRLVSGPPIRGGDTTASERSYLPVGLSAPSLPIAQDRGDGSSGGGFSGFLDGLVDSLRLLKFGFDEGFEEL